MNRTDKDETMERVHELTKDGMEGNISVEESLSERIKLLKLTRSEIRSLAPGMKKYMAGSFSENVDAFNANYNVLVVSGGFGDVIEPILKPYGIDTIYSNTLIYDSEEVVIDMDWDHPLAHNHGKVAFVKTLGLDPSVTVMVGDGMSDYELKGEGLVSKFIYYDEFVQREDVLKKADVVVKNFNELRVWLNSTEGLGYDVSNVVSEKEAN